MNYEIDCEYFLEHGQNLLQKSSEEDILMQV